MLSKAARQSLFGGGVLILIGVLWLVNWSVGFSPWVWVAFLAGAGLGAFGLTLADRSDGLMLLAGYVLWVIAGLIALVPSGFLRDEAIACYVLSTIALPFVVIYVQNRARRWALIPAYPLLAVVGVIAVSVIAPAESGRVSDDLISAYVVLVIAIPFFVLYAWDRKRWWALIPGSALAVLGLSFGTWLPWSSVRSSLIAGDAVKVAAALALLIVGVWILVRAFVAEAPSGAAALPGSDEPPAA